MRKLRKMILLGVATVMVMVSGVSVSDAEAQSRRTLANEGGRDFYVAVRGAYPFTSITKVGGAGIIGLGYRPSPMFRAELELIYGNVTAEVDEGGQVTLLPNPLAAPNISTNPILSMASVPVEFEAENDNFLVMANFYMDLDVMPKKWRVKPYIGFSIGYARTDTAPDYGNAGDVAVITRAISGDLDKELKDRDPNAPFISGPTSPTIQIEAARRAVAQTYVRGVYAQVRAALPAAQQAQLPSSLNFAAADFANTQQGQQQAAGRQLAYQAIATGIANGGDVGTTFVPGIKQSIPVGELQSLVVGAMVGAVVDIGHNAFVDTGYRFVRAQKDIKNFHEIRLGVGYNFAINY